MSAPAGEPVLSRAGQPADLGTRFLARLIDVILLGVVQAVLFAGAALFWTAASYAGADDVLPLRALDDPVGSLVGAAITLGYFVLLESARGQTLGKMVMRIETRTLDGGRPTYEQAFKRNIWTAIGVLAVLPFIGGFFTGLAQLAAVISIAVTINNSPAKRGWHDDLGGTAVVRVA